MSTYIHLYYSARKLITNLDLKILVMKRSATQVFFFLIITVTLSQAQVNNGLSIEIAALQNDQPVNQLSYDDEYNWDSNSPTATALIQFRYCKFQLNQQHWSISLGVGANNDRLQIDNIRYDSEFDDNGLYVRDSTLYHNLNRTNHNGYIAFGGAYGKFFGKNNSGLSISVGLMGFLRYRTIKRSYFHDDAIYIDGVLGSSSIGTEYTNFSTNPNIRNFSLHVPIKLEYHLRIMEKFRIYGGLRSHIKAITFIKNLDLSNRLLSMGITLGAAYDW